MDDLDSINDPSGNQSQTGSQQTTLDLQEQDEPEASSTLFLVALIAVIILMGVAAAISCCRCCRKEGREIQVDSEGYRSSPDAPVVNSMADAFDHGQLRNSDRYLSSPDVPEVQSMVEAFGCGQLHNADRHPINPDAPVVNRMVDAFGYEQLHSAAEIDGRAFGGPIRFESQRM